MHSNPIALASIVAAGTIGAAVDVRTHRVPNWLTAGTAAAGLMLGFGHAAGLGIAAAAAGLLVGGVLMLPGHIFGGSGAGDVKLLAAFGTFLGPRTVVWAFLYAAIAGGALAVFIASRRRRLGESVARTAALVSTGGANVAEIESPSANNRFAFAPAIALGALVAALGV